MSEHKPNRERYLLSEAENSRIFREYLLPLEYGDVQGVDTPYVHFFGAQPGAGKSVLQGSVRDELIARDGLNTVMTIAGDRFRAYHPEYGRLLEEDDESAALYTDMDTNRWVEQAVNASYDLRPHVILENPKVSSLLGSAGLTAVDFQLFDRLYQQGQSIFVHGSITADRITHESDIDFTIIGNTSEIAPELREALVPGLDAVKKVVQSTTFLPQ